MDLAEAAWTDVADCETDLAVLPVGSTEQHGPHLPLGTDAITAEAVAELGAERADRPVIVAPTLPVGVAAEHRHFDGTMWLSPDTFRATVRDCLESLASHGFDRLVVVNGHGGNVDALHEVTATVSRETAAHAVAFTWFEALDEPAVDLGHGGPIETAAIQQLRPDLVREDRLEAARDGAAERWGEWVGSVNLAHDSHEFTESGVVGDPTDGDAALGEKLLGEAADELVAVLETLADR